MNTHDLSNALLLRDSGELSATELAELEALLLHNPEAVAQAQENELLQEAGRYASRQTVPALRELDQARIQQAAAKHPSRWFPKVLAAAAAVAILFFALPFFTSPPPSAHTIQVVQNDPVLTPEVTTPAQIQETDLWQEVDALEAEIAAWQSLSLDEAWLVEDEANWAAELLTPGESI